jgi:ABC-type nitrate/sulfonate/bicarbonate transport system permease component
MKKLVRFHTNERMNTTASLLRRAAGALLFISAAVVIVIVWQIVVVLTRPDPSILPPPIDVLATFGQLVRNGALATDTAYSLARVGSAWVLSALIAVPLGLLMGASRSIEHIVNPFVELLRPISPLAWIPLAILWFGIGEAGKIFVVCIGAFFPVLLNTVAGVKGVDPTLLHAGRVFGCNTRFALFRRVLVPASMPAVVVGLRIGFGTGWAAIIAAELVAAQSGLGFLIANGMDILRADEVLAGMVVIGILGLLFDTFFRYLQRRFGYVD